MIETNAKLSGVFCNVNNLWSYLTDYLVRDAGLPPDFHKPPGPHGLRISSMRPVRFSALFLHTSRFKNITPQIA